MTGRGRVLVVDDEPAVRDVLREFLDLLLPGISGLEVLNYVRRHHPTEPVIVITGNIDHQMASQARAGGDFAVVGTPIDFDALEALVARAMTLAPRP